MSKISEISYALINALGQDATPQQILDLGHDFLKNPIHMTDLTGRLIASTKKSGYVDAIWAQIEDNGYIDYETFKTICQANVLKISRNPQPMIIQSAPHNVNLLVCGLVFEKHYKANLIVLEKDHIFQEEDKKILSLLTTALNVLFAPQWQSQDSSFDSIDELVCELLDAPVTNREGLYERCKIVSLVPAPPMQILTICNSRNIASIPILKMTRSRLRDLFYTSRTIIHNNRTVTVLSKKTLDLTLPEEQKLLKFLEQYGLTASLSRPFERLEDTYEHYMQTLHALEYGSIIHKNRRFYDYKDYAIYRLLAENEQSRNLCHPCIRQLMDYDARHGMDYTQTLYAYITCLRDLREAAAMMNLHYNTVKYRLRKITDLLGTDLTDNDMFLLLALSFRRLELDGHIFKGGFAHE